jgi:hypothetical protein
MFNVLRIELLAGFAFLFFLSILIPERASSETTVSPQGAFYTLPLQAGALDSLVSIAPHSGQSALATVEPVERIQLGIFAKKVVNGPWHAVASLETGDGQRGLAFWRRDGTFRIVEGVDSHSAGAVHLQAVKRHLVNGYETFFSGRFYPGNDKQFLFISPGSGENRIVQIKPDGTVSFDRYIAESHVNNYQLATAGDFDGDGRTDLFLWHLQSGANRLVLSHGSNPENGQFTIRSISSSLINGGDFNRVLAVNVSGDGADELFFYHTGNGKQRLITNLTGTAEIQTDPFPRERFRNLNSVIAGNFLAQAGEELALVGNKGQLLIASLHGSAQTSVTGINMIPNNVGLLLNLPEDPRARGARLKSAVEAGGTVRLPPVDFVLSSPIDVPSNTLISGAPGATVFLDARHFNNQNRYNVDDIKQGKPVGFRIRNKSNVTIEGLTIRLFHSAGGSVDRRFVRAITVRNSDNVVIRSNDISAFSNANGIIAIDSGRGVNISDNAIHDSFTDYMQGEFVQLTGINIDDQRVNGASSGISIERNTIRNLLVSDRIARERGFETDGINVSSSSTSGIVIRFNKIENVGEGIDTFGRSGRIYCNEIIEPKLFGIKLIHGARGNQVRDNLITTAGNAAIVLAGSSTMCADTRDNQIFRNEIRGIRHGTVGIKFQGNNGGSCSRPISNNIYNNGFFDFQNGVTFVLPAGFGNSFHNNRPNPNNFSRSCSN